MKIHETLILLLTVIINFFLNLKLSRNVLETSLKGDYKKLVNWELSKRIHEELINS